MFVSCKNYPAAFTTFQRIPELIPVNRKTRWCSDKRLAIAEHLTNAVFLVFRCTARGQLMVFGRSQNCKIQSGVHFFRGTKEN
ncbi:MAG: hypothetical protein CMM01_21330 [Rhodopirellula sp.]|nr:hypothetical protein [Rhodopirellula sp.]OUX49601.1 MAG: hypothetical protein CBE43_09820 [Rhodopirellula sp. TMED283]